MRCMRGRPVRAFVGVLAAVVLAGCSSSQQSPEVPVRYQDPEVGAARLMADSTPRVRDVINVTSGYLDPDNNVVGAAVLIDSRINPGAPTTDTRHRPVFVVYASDAAARAAVATRLSGRYLRNGIRVIYLPAGFPDSARMAYEEGIGAALQ
jgi:hypothetical protein